MPLPRSEIIGQFRSYLTSDHYPPDVHFKCDLCPTKAEVFIEHKVWEGGSQVFNPKYITEIVQNSPSGGRRFIILVPMCNLHKSRFRKTLPRLEYDTGRSRLWRFFRRQMVERVMED